MEAKIAAAKVQAGLHNVSDNELVEIYSALKGNEEYKVQFNKLMHQAGTRLKKILDEDERAQSQFNGGAASGITADEQTVSRNLTQLESFSQVNPLDDKNKEFATSRAYLNNMVVVDAQGKQVDVSANIIEIAKLKTAADLTNSSEPLSQEVYNNRLRDNIDMSIYGIMMTNLVSNSNNSPETFQKSMNAMLDGQKQTVTTASASAILATQVVTLSKFADNLVSKFKSLNLAQKFKNKVEQANANLTQKLKDTYVKARTYAQILQEQGALADIGMAFVGATGGPIGMAAYGAWTYYRRVHPLYKAYREEKKNNPEMKSFWKYLGKHKKDSMFAGLYMASSVASFAVAGVAAAQAITHGTTLAQASVAPLVQAKAAIAFSTVAARCTTDIAQAWGTPDMSKAVKRSIGSIAMYGVGYELAHALAGAHDGASADHSSTPSHTDTPSQTPVEAKDDNFNYVVKPAEKEAFTFKPFPWQETLADNSAVDASADAPADHGTAVQTDHSELAGTPAHEYTVGAREQAVYERNLKIVDKADIMVANVKDDIVELPKGMTPEMAVNLARVQMLYYGDDTGLKILLDCDEVSKISSTGYFDNLASKFTDSCNAPYGVGFPKDPNYGYADPNIYTRSIEVDCEKTILHGGRTVATDPTPAPEQPIETKIPTPAQNSNPDELPATPKTDTPTQTSTEVENPTQSENETTLEQPHLKGVGGNTPLNNNINEETTRIGANGLGADGEGNIVRVDTEQNNALPKTPNGNVPTSGKGTKSLNPALFGGGFNTFDL